MKICFPVERNHGWHSLIYKSFSCAPEYVITDTDDCEVSALADIDRILRYGTCDPVDCAKEREIDAVIVQTISDAMLDKFNRVDVKVYQTGTDTVLESITLLSKHVLNELVSKRGHHSHT